MSTYERRSRLPVEAPEAYDWHARDGAFERLRAPWLDQHVIERAAGIQDGRRLVMQVRLGPVRRRWVAVHRDTDPGRSFVDEQVEGPFRRWVHRHTFRPAASGCVLEDHVDYELPCGAAGRLVAGPSVRRTLANLFAFRHRRTVDDLARHAACAARPRLRVLVSGASGMIGTELSAFLRSGGHDVVSLVRRTPRDETEIAWRPDEGRGPDPASVDGVDAVVHLAGASIAGGRWTTARRRAIYESRVAGTGLLAATLAGLEHPPQVFLSASAMGFYGDRGDAVLDEGSPAGCGFLPDVCEAWERAADPAVDAGIRTIFLRSGLVLTGRGGALMKMLPALELAAGGPMGGGRQWVSWISLEDWLGAALMLLYDERLSGPVNLTTPEPVTNREFIATIGDVVHRPERIPLPATAIEVGLGEMGRRMLLDSLRVTPAKLIAAGFPYRYPRLADALRLELGLLEGRREEPVARSRAT